MPWLRGEAQGGEWRRRCDFAEHAAGLPTHAAGALQLLLGVSVIGTLCFGAIIKGNKWERKPRPSAAGQRWAKGEPRRGRAGGQSGFREEVLALRRMALNAKITKCLFPVFFYLMFSDHGFPV